MALSPEDKGDVKKHLGKALANKVAKVTRDGKTSKKSTLISSKKIDITHLFDKKTNPNLGKKPVYANPEAGDSPANNYGRPINYKPVIKR